MFKVCAPFLPAGDQPVAIQALVKGIENHFSHQTLLGVTGSGKTFTIAHLIQETQRPALVMAPNKILAAQLYHEMKEFFPENAVEYFVSYYDYYQPEAYVPSSDTYIEKDSSVNAQIEQMRLSATKAMLQRRDAIVVASVSAIYGLGDPKMYLSMILHLDRNESIPQSVVVKRLVDMQYSRNPLELKRATFRVHGDVLDVYPAESEQEAIRIEWFGDVVEGIYAFDPLTGRVRRALARTTIFPKTHYVTPRAQILLAAEQISAELRQRLQELEGQGRLVEAQRLKQRTEYDLEMLLQLGYCNGIENYSRHLTGNLEGQPPATLLDYLPSDGLVVLDESHVLVPQIGAMYRGDRARKETLVNYGFRLPSALDNRPLRSEEFFARASKLIYVSATPGPWELSCSQQVVEQVVRPTGLVDPMLEVRPVRTQVEDVLSEINLRVPQKERVLITTLTKKMAENLTEYLKEHGVRVRYLHSDIPTIERVALIRDLRLGHYDVLVGINLLREGLDIPEVSLVAIFDADKEGFLRSERSLIQTIGRAARHLKGYVILYADVMTQSMQRAIGETERRRNMQLEFNQKNNVTPQSVQKSIRELMGEEEIQQDPTTPVDLPTTAKAWSNLLSSLEQKMLSAATELKFEEATQYRDELKRMKELFLNSEFGS